tara:strand:- start:21526 stop:22398 length:873 start_codon:yes stop_codon:yes gene_type:complete
MGLFRKPTLINTTKTLNNFYSDFEQILDAVKEPINSIPRGELYKDTHNKYHSDIKKFKKTFENLLKTQSKEIRDLKNNVVEYTKNLSLDSCSTNIKYDKCQIEKLNIYYKYLFLLKLIRLLDNEIYCAIRPDYPCSESIYYRNNDITYFDSMLKMRVKIDYHQKKLTNNNNTFYKINTNNTNYKSFSKIIDNIDTEIKKILEEVGSDSDNSTKSNKILSLKKNFYNLHLSINNSIGGKKTAPKKKPITKKPVKKVTPKKKPITKKPVKKVVPKKKSNVKNLVTKKPATKK